jgi:hypothetical protein
MTAAIVARVGPHSDVADLAKHSSVPVINALSDLYHPLQIIADLLTMAEIYPSTSSTSLGLEGLKIAWIGDANNVLFDLAIGATKLGIDIAVATPAGYEIPKAMREVISHAAQTSPHPGKLFETNRKRRLPSASKPSPASRSPLNWRNVAAPRTTGASCIAYPGIPRRLLMRSFTGRGVSCSRRQRTGYGQPFLRWKPSL